MRPGQIRSHPGICSLSNNALTLLKPGAQGAGAAFRLPKLAARCLTKLLPNSRTFCSYYGVQELPVICWAYTPEFRLSGIVY
jgi:hypothetical protein